MQGKEILTKIQPYIKDNEVLMADFQKEFGQFTISEQKTLIDSLSKININVVDFYSQQGNMESGKWFFPSGRDLQKIAAANPAIENFRDNSLSSMTREVCQNSLDAVVDNAKPVTVKFKEFDIDAEDLPGYDTLKEDILPAAKREWLEDKKTQQLICSMENCLSREKIKVLKISDFNTTGLKHGNWESLVEQVGSSFKSDEGSAGSFGIGKAAPFAVSQLWMVFTAPKLVIPRNQLVLCSLYRLKRELRLHKDLAILVLMEKVRSHFLMKYRLILRNVQKMVLIFTS